VQKTPDGMLTSIGRANASGSDRSRIRRRRATRSYKRRWEALGKQSPANKKRPGVHERVKGSSQKKTKNRHENSEPRRGNLRETSMQIVKADLSKKKKKRKLAFPRHAAGEAIPLTREALCAQVLEKRKKRKLTQGPCSSTKKMIKKGPSTRTQSIRPGRRPQRMPTRIARKGKLTRIKNRLL